MFQVERIGWSFRMLGQGTESAVLEVHVGTGSAACNFLYSHVLTQYDSKDLNVVR